ncbi:hypothetical protein KKE33_01505 [Patescibacteria group bacterium]|nr:hypothetical protein [Patescibacteria group bacterium]
MITADKHKVNRARSRQQAWDLRYPDKGHDIMRLLEPFYSVTDSVSFNLQPALPDLIQRSHQAIFWRDIQGVRIVPMVESDSLEELLHEKFKGEVTDDDRGAIVREFDDSLKDALRDSIKGMQTDECPRWARCLSDLRHGYGVSGVIVPLIMNCVVWANAENKPISNAFMELIRLTLESLFMYQIGFTVADQPEMAAKFQPLLDLWLAGNFPVGFDKDGNLLILVADPE